MVDTISAQSRAQSGSVRHIVATLSAAILERHPPHLGASVGRRRFLLGPNTSYHVTARGNNREPIFHTDTDRWRLLAILDAVSTSRGWRQSAWCLMGNHFHLLTTTCDADLSDGMREILSRYARGFNFRHQRSGHLFGEAFGATVVDTDEYLLMAVRYINQNPVRAGIVQRVADYPWCDFGCAPARQLASFDRSVVTGLLHPHPEIGGRQLQELIEGTTAPSRATQPPPAVANLVAALGRPGAVRTAGQLGYSCDEIARAAGLTHSAVYGHLRSLANDRHGSAADDSRRLQLIEESKRRRTAIVSRHAARTSAQGTPEAS